MSLKPAAEWRDAWLKGDRTLRDFILAIQADTYQAGREAGFAAGIAAARAALIHFAAGGVKTEPLMMTVCRCADIVGDLNCPAPEAESEGETDG